MTYDCPTFSGRVMVVDYRADDDIRTRVDGVPVRWWATEALASYLYANRVEVPAPVAAALDRAGVVQIADADMARLDRYHADHELPACSRFTRRAYLGEILDGLTGEGY